MTIKTSVIRPVVAEAKRTFPVREYGYGARFSAPGSRITVSELNGAPCLVLHSPVGRRAENGRYSHGWDCFEASYFIRNRLNGSGINSGIIELNTPLYSRDYAVQVPGVDYLSITPGVHNEHIESCTDKKPLEDDRADHIWEHNRTADLCLTNGIRVYGWQKKFGIDIMNCFSLNVRKDGMFRIWTNSSSIRNRVFGDVIDLFYSVPPKDIERCRTAFLMDGNRKGFSFMTRSEEFSSMDAEDKIGDFYAALETARALAHKVVPMVMRLIDRKASGFLSSRDAE